MLYEEVGFVKKENWLEEIRRIKNVLEEFRRFWKKIKNIEKLGFVMFQIIHNNFSTRYERLSIKYF